MPIENTAIADQVRDLMETADKLKAYKNVDTALEDTKRWLKSAESDLKDAKAELAKIKADIDARKASYQQLERDHKAQLESITATMQEGARQKLAAMETNARAAVTSLDAQLTAKQKELETKKKDLQAATAELEDIHLAFTDAFEVIDAARGRK